MPVDNMSIRARTGAVQAPKRGRGPVRVPAGPGELRPLRMRNEANRRFGHGEGGRVRCRIGPADLSEDGCDLLELADRMVLAAELACGVLWRCDRHCRRHEREIALAQ